MNENDILEKRFLILRFWKILDQFFDSLTPKFINKSWKFRILPKSTYNYNMGTLNASWVELQIKVFISLNVKLHENWRSKSESTMFVILF